MSKSSPKYFRFAAHLSELEFSALEADKALKLYQASRKTHKMLQKAGYENKGISEPDYKELDRVFFEMVFVTFCARIERAMTKLLEEIDVYEIWKTEGKTETSANIARKIMQSRPQSTPKPVALQKVKEAYYRNFKTTNNAGNWEYLKTCYGRRDMLMHGKEKVSAVKQGLRLRTGAVSKLATIIKNICSSFRSKTGF